MEKVIQFFNGIISTVTTFFQGVVQKAVNFYSSTLVELYKKHLVSRFAFLQNVKLWWILLGLAVLLLIIFIIIICSICKRKKRKVRFYAFGELIKTEKVRYKKPIPFATAPCKEGLQFDCWCLDEEGKIPYEKEVLDRKKKLNLYASYKKVETPASVEVQQAPQLQVEPTNVEVPVQESVDSGADYEVLSLELESDELSSQFVYDELRYAMLGYERAMQFKKLGVVRKQNIAEMFEKDGEVYLYLKVEPKLMLEKGYQVEEHTDSRFSPCKKVVKTKKDLQEALGLIKEAMTVNNLVKSETTFAQKPASNEAIRKSGFAFFVKNETVAVSADDYYRLLRAIVLSYHKAENSVTEESAKNKMILKIYKKGENVNVYLALDPIENGLKDVSYDRSFQDTPSLIEVKTAEDCALANLTIDKLMYRYGMERRPEKAEISMDDAIENNCGFGYRIK